MIGIRYSNRYFFFLSSRDKKYLIKGILKDIKNKIKKKEVLIGCKKSEEESREFVGKKFEVINLPMTLIISYFTKYIEPIIEKNTEE